MFLNLFAWQRSLAEMGQSLAVHCAKKLDEIGRELSVTKLR